MLKRLLVIAYLAACVGTAALASDHAQKTLVVGSEENFPPFSTGDTDESAGGFTVDLWKEVAKEAGLQYRLRVGPWGQILQEFRDGKIDVLLNVATSEERRRYTDFSVPHVTVNGAIFVRNGDSRIRSEEDLAGKSLIVFQSDLAREYAVSKGWKSRLVPVKNAQEGLRLLASGKHDAMLLSKLAGMQLIKESGIENVKPLDVKVGYAQKFAFGVHKGESELLEKLNEGLAMTKADADYEGLYQKWFGVYGTKDPTFRDMLRYLLPFGAAGACLGGFLLYRRGIERKVLEDKLRKKTAQLEEQLAEREMAQESLQEQTVILEEEIEVRRRAEHALLQNEATIRNKLKAILEPEGDIGTLELSDIVDCEVLQSMMDDFYKITGMVGAVLDVSGKVLVAVGWQDICTRFHRCHPDTLRNCIESDTVLTNGVEAGTFRQYRCKNNMWDMVTPIEVGGRHVGNVFIGQFFYDDETPDLELFREQARRYGFDEAQYLAALDRVPRFTREAAAAGMQFYAQLTRMISTLSFASIKVSRMLAERIHLEEQLRQSQKMEAVGQLAGGVAHDFNNILQVISGYGNLLKLDDALEDRQKEMVGHILSSSEKAAQLTRGLLAFSRKQVIMPAPVDLNDVIESFKKFIIRVIGEDIQLKTITHASRLGVYADTGQIEQVLVNLATNARDCMPKGGLLIIETGLQAVEAPIDHEFGSAEPGRYAVVTVSDTGTGMDEATRKRIFEPFFTTKEVGKGTGLGMSIVYGIVKQHNGVINVYSEPGHGTTFRIYLPIHDAEEPMPDAEAAHADPGGGNETILLAEDDADVRELAVSVLANAGYDVIQAVDGQDVVDKFAANMERVSMILMDMIMPKKNGKEAYEEISLLQPGVKVLYSSGYTADFIENRGVSDEGIELIMKPVQPMDLLRKVREMLER